MMNRKKNLLDRFRELEFALLETSLYLDTHPNNTKALEYYKKLKGERDVVYADYVTNVAPLYSADVRQENWSWLDEPWPWQNDIKEG